MNNDNKVKIKDLPSVIIEQGKNADESSKALLKDIFVDAIKDVTNDVRKEDAKARKQKIAQMSKIAFEENKKYEELIDKIDKKDKYKAKTQGLDIYRGYRDIRSYLYTATAHMNKHAKFLFAQPLMNDVCDAIKNLAFFANSSKFEDKINYVEKFISFHEMLIDKIEFCVEIKALDFKQASRLLSLAIALDNQVKNLKKTLNSPHDEI